MSAIHTVPFGSVPVSWVTPSVVAPAPVGAPTMLSAIADVAARDNATLRSDLIGVLQGVRDPQRGWPSGCACCHDVLRMYRFPDDYFSGNLITARVRSRSRLPFGPSRRAGPGRAGYAGSNEAEIARTGDPSARIRLLFKSSSSQARRACRRRTETGHLAHYWRCRGGGWIIADSYPPGLGG